MHNSSVRKNFSCGTAGAFSVSAACTGRSRLGATLPHWATLDNGLQMNQQHVFCGEWEDNRPKGFHSRPGGVNPAMSESLRCKTRPIQREYIPGNGPIIMIPIKANFLPCFPTTARLSKSSIPFPMRRRIPILPGRRSGLGEMRQKQTRFSYQGGVAGLLQPQRGAFLDWLCRASKRQDQHGISDTAMMIR